MGLLDEAIREHLELKRRHGADPGEVARLEHEALGPARREAAPAPAAGDEPAPAPTAGDEPASAEEQLSGGDPAFAEPDVYDPTDEDERVERLAEDEEGLYDDDLLGDEEPGLYDDEPRAGDEEPPRPPPARPAAEEAPDDAGEGPSTVEQPTVQFDIRDAEEPPASGAEPAHDELEDTPEFLQETPEHDRLWFEQKPPKDFDF